MQKQLHHIVSEFILQARSSVRVYTGGHLDEELIEECFRIVKRDIAVELSFSHQLIAKIEAQSFLLNKIYQLREAGASIFSVSDFAGKPN